MSYRCIECGFWTGPRVVHWIDHEGRCRSCARPPASSAPPVLPLAAPPVVPSRPGPVERPPTVAPPRIGVVAAVVLTLMMLVLTTIPAQPSARATAGPPPGPVQTHGNPNAGCHQQDDLVGGPYDATCDGSPSQNGNGPGGNPGPPCAGCVGNADNQQPPGQLPGGSDANNGYECDGNQGVGQGNPAHTSCTPGSDGDPTPTPTPTPTVTVTVTPTPTPTPTVTVTPTPTPTPTVTVTPTPTPTPTVTVTPTPTPTPTVTVTPTPTPTDQNGPVVDDNPSGPQPPVIVDGVPPVGPPIDGGPPLGTPPVNGVPPVDGGPPGLEPDLVLGVRISAAPDQAEVLGAALEAAPEPRAKVAPARALPFTGTAAVRWISIGLGLIVLGSLLTRRRASG